MGHTQTSQTDLVFLDGSVTRVQESTIGLRRLPRAVNRRSRKANTRERSHAGARAIPRRTFNPRWTQLDNHSDGRPTEFILRRVIEGALVSLANSRRLQHQSRESGRTKQSLCPPS